MSEKKNGVASVNPNEFQFAQPTEKQSLSQFFYNKKDGTIFGRTMGSWGRLFIFYAIFYAILAGLFAICLQGLFSTLSDNEPKWKLHSSIIGTNPGLGFRPLTNETEKGSVIEFDTKKPLEGQYWKELLDDFLQPYNTTGGINQKVCDFGQQPDPKKVCMVDMNSFGPCSPKNGYGYANGRPCIFLKLNKIYDWIPEFYDNADDIPKLPMNGSDELIAYVRSIADPNQRKQIWITCKGQFDSDAENIGSIKYYPSRGFPSYYYPYQNQPGYLSPLVAIQFESLKLHQMLNVECRAWAKNIEYNGSLRDRMGSVTFQLYVD